MSNKKYEFDNRKPGVLSKIGSTAIAVGSVATAITIAMPSAGSFFVQATQEAASAIGIDTGLNQTSEQQLAGNVSGQAAGTSTPNPIDSATSETYQMSVDASGTSLPTAMASATAAATQDPAVVTAPSTTKAPSPTSTTVAAPLDLAPISSGNVSSATPTASGGYGSGTSATDQTPLSSGNISSATPLGSSGSGYEDDDDDDEYEDHDDDRDDDRDHDDDDDDDDRDHDDDD